MGHCHADEVKHTSSGPWYASMRVRKTYWALLCNDFSMRSASSEIALGVTTRLSARFGTGAAIGQRMLVAVEGLGVAYPCCVVH